MMDSPHIPVLPNEVLNAFGNVNNGVIVDCTLGYGGHSNMLLDALKNIKIIGIDKDIEAIDFNVKTLPTKRSKIIKDDFKDGILRAIDIARKDDLQISGILADIGVSSYQLDKLDRGFSFKSPNLDMRMDADNLTNAKIILNTYPTNELERIFKEYGEIREYKKLAKIIADRRKVKAFESGIELSQLCESNFKKIGKIHPATLCFQALRIEVNDELMALKKFLKNIENNIKDNKLNHSIIAIISFHSLEDRIIKDVFKQWSRNCICEEHVYKCECGGNNALGVNITKKPIIASEREIKQNPRARSAKLRIFQVKD